MVGALEVNVADNRRAAVTGTGQAEDVEAVLIDCPVQVHIQASAFPITGPPRQITFLPLSSTPWRAEKHSWDQAGPHSRHFVGGDARTHAATADGHTAVNFAASNCTGQGHNKVRLVIVRLRLAVAKVDHSAARPTHLGVVGSTVCESDIFLLRQG
jgi:hypothetical protein